MADTIHNESQTPEAEADNLLALNQGDPCAALQWVERQLNTLYTRAQVLVSLAGAVVTVTGFSGRTIAETNTPAKLLLTAGLAVVVLSAAYVVLVVMRIKWVTAALRPDDPRHVLVTALKRRDVKTRAYRLGGAALCLGLILYAGAIAIMLLVAS